MTHDSKELRDLANELSKARDAYLDAIGRGPGGEVEKLALQELLWNDKSTIIHALQSIASPAPQPGMRAEGEVRNAALEDAAVYHDKAAVECRAIAAVNQDNDLGADSATHAIDHDVAAEDIRAMKHALPAASPAEASDLCIDCDGSGKYPSGKSCKSCAGTGRVCCGDGIKSAPPKPVPDAMREALIGRLEKGPYPVRWKTASPLTEEDRQDIVAILSETAPVPPPDGGATDEIQSSDRGVESQTRKELSADAQSLIAAGNVDSLGVAPGRSEAIPPPSDDVRSALADQIEREGIEVYGTWHPRETIKQIIVTALRSAPVSAPAPRGVLKQNDDRPLPTYGQIPWVQLGRDVMDAIYASRKDFEFGEGYPGHTMLPALNFNSLARIVDKYRWYGIEGRAPAVGVTREAVARIIDPEAFEGLARAPETGSEREYAHECEQRKVEALTKANAIIRSPAPDATISQLAPKEPTPEMAAAGRKALAIVADRMEEAKLLATSSIDFWQRVGHEPANEIYKAMLVAFPQHVGREAAVSDERALRLAERIHAQKLSVDDAACEIMQYATDGVLQLEREGYFGKGAPISARDAVIEALSKGFMTACSGDGEHQIKIGFETLARMQTAHRALVDLLK